MYLHAVQVLLRTLFRIGVIIGPSENTVCATKESVLSISITIILARNKDDIIGSINSLAIRLIILDI